MKKNYCSVILSGDSSLLEETMFMLTYASVCAWRTFIQPMIRQSIMSDNDEAWDVSVAMNKIRTALEENGDSVEDLFSAIDGDGDGQISGPELFKGLKEAIGNRLSPSQVSMIIKSLDTNQDNHIDLEELKSGIESSSNE